MNTPTITLPREVAREQLRQYRSQLHHRADSEYQAVAAGLEALAAGTPLLDLGECFRKGPLDEKHRPKLAIARADRTSVRFSWETNSRGRFDARAPRIRGGWREPSPRTMGSLVIDVELPRLDDGAWPGRGAATSKVPMIPASVREKLGPIALPQHFILWEADWTEVPRDPYLLRWTGAGNLYAILAEWDLTELERAVMAGRP